jgi:hypothetical protein
MPNTVRASGEAMPKINRRRFLLNTTMAGAAVAAAAPVAAAEPVMTTRERAIWHMRELERLISEAGNGSVSIFACGHYTDEDGQRDVRVFGLRHGRIDNDDGIFEQEGDEA